MSISGNRQGFWYTAKYMKLWDKLHRNYYIDYIVYTKNSNDIIQRLYFVGLSGRHLNRIETKISCGWFLSARTEPCLPEKTEVQPIKEIVAYFWQSSKY